MEMEVVLPLPVPLPLPVAPLDFNFDSNCSSPYITAPSSPQRFGGNLFLTAPPSPSSSSFYRHFNQDASPPSNDADNCSQDFHFLDDHDFEFDFSGQLDRTSLSADELFDGGKIRPLKPPPGYDSSTASPERQRGRERTTSGSKSPNYVHKGSRSVSPLRVSDLILDEEEDNSTHDCKTETSNPKSSYASSFLSAISFSSKGYKKWKLKDLLLFRSASEGRAIGKDQLNKYTVLSKRSQVVEDVKNSSFRSTDSSSVGNSSRRRGRVSAHELHYTANRAVAEEMKRKTVLPYKHGLLGCLGFNHDISKSIGSLTRG
ncbi:uncharacterized protein [Euphorbia lathyris]|uniref:uncharacterized protein n=1 Tax=Euphorbia lathyris TaxID=212925 RepID=UPI00331443E1